MKKIKNLLLIALFASATALAGCSSPSIAAPDVPSAPDTPSDSRGMPEPRNF